MSSKAAKKRDSAHRLGSAMGHTPRDTASVVASSLAASVELKKRKYSIWPEWNEADINSEKWDSGKPGKEKDKAGKSPAVHLFDDPDGKIELPSNLKVHCWKRPHEFILNTTPVIVKDEMSCDLLSSNEHLIGSELMRWIISEVSTVWRIFNNHVMDNKAASVEPPTLAWKPWEHIYALCKAAKGHVPLYNSYGKYIVKLYWMGCWRKVTVDDTLPFSDDDKMLLPATACEAELWPMLLAKAIIKLANAETHGFAKHELGEFTVLHSLTGWLPEVIPLQNDYLSEVWNFLTRIVPEFKLPCDESPESKCGATEEKMRDKPVEIRADLQIPAIMKTSDRGSRDKSDLKEAGKKRSDKEKRSGSHSARPPSELSNPLQQSTDYTSAPPVPQMVVYASYLPLHLSEQKISVLGQMADSSEKLRHYGLSHVYNHPVLVSRTRSCPLVAPPKPPPVPRWKLIRQKKELNVTDEAKVAMEKKPEQFVELSTLFANTQLNSVAVPSEGLVVTSTSQRSTLVTSSLASVSETEENVQENNSDGNENIQQSFEEGTSQVYCTSQQSILRSSNLSDSLGEVVGGDIQATECSSHPEPEMKRAMETKQIWMDFSDFCKCFQTLYIFHKPNTYPYSFQRSDFKITDERDRASYFLFVDNMKPTEILVSFSALVRCRDFPGLLTAECFSWKSLLTGPVVLKIDTNVTKAAMISLPPGRHVLRFTIRSSLGHHIHLCSTVPFIFGDEETVMPYLDKESYRTIEMANNIIKAVLKSMQHFSNENEQETVLKELDLTHYPLEIKSKHLQKTDQHFKAFNFALWKLMSEALGNKVTPDLALAFRAFTFDFSTVLSADSQSVQESKSEFVSSWEHASESEELAATKLQAWWRGLYIMKCRNARKPGSKENAVVKATLDKICAAIETNAEHYGISLLRYLFSHSPASHDYPCYEDERYRITFTDYSITYSDQPPNSWFVVFREVFHVSEEMLVVPKMYSNLPVCTLHVINNDTLKEIPHVFNHVTPHVYTNNKKGYTFMAEAHTGESGVASGKWRLRLIGVRHPLPSLSRDTANNAFSIREIRDYYIPNKKDLICRYSVKAGVEHVATIHLQTSSSEVLIKLQIFDNDEEVVSASGKGQALIPAFCFLPNERPFSSQSSKSHIFANGTKKARAGSGSSQKSKPSSSSESIAEFQVTGENEGNKDKTPTPQPNHKYIIQATVLYKSWKLTEGQVAFVQTYKDMEKQETKVYTDRHDETASESNSSESQKSASAPKTARKGRERSEKPEKEKSGKDRERLQPTPTFRPESQAHQQTDANKPFWTLRLVSESSEADTLDVKKDTERLDEIRAIKQAWEMAEPGRAVKALQSRLKYVNKYIQKTSSEPEDHDASQNSMPDDVPASKMQDHLSSSSSDFMASSLQNALDLTPFLRKTKPEPVLRDEYIIQQQAMEKAKEIRQFRQLREEVLKQRELDQNARNLLKQKALQLYEDLQMSLDHCRERFLSARESYRNKVLEAGKQKQDSDTVAAVAAEQEKKTPSASKRKSAKSAGKKK